MPRSERQVPNFYFGRPGQLVTLPYPLGAIDRTADRQTYDFLTGSGLHQVSTLAQAARSYTFNWNALHQETFTRLEQFRLGANGPGPWAFIDPSAPNILPANVAAATGVFSDATDLYTDGVTEGVPGSNDNATFIHRTTGYRSIRWLFSDASIATFPTLRIRPQFRNWAGTPVMPGLAYAFSSWMRVDGTVETSATMALKLVWLNAAGTQILESTDADSAVTSTWVRKTLTATAPAGAAYVAPRWVATGSSLVTGGAIYIDEPILEQDSVFNDWAPGTGVRPVEIVALTEGVPFEARFRTSVQMGLRELTK